MKSIEDTKIKIALGMLDELGAVRELATQMLVVLNYAEWHDETVYDYAARRCIWCGNVDSEGHSDKCMANNVRSAAHALGIRGGH